MSGIRIDIGPLKWNEFCAFLPETHKEKINSHKHFRYLCQIYVGLNYIITAKIILARTEIKLTLLQSILTTPIPRFIWDLIHGCSEPVLHQKMYRPNYGLGILDDY